MKRMLALVVVLLFAAGCGIQPDPKKTACDCASLSLRQLEAAITIMGDANVDARQNRTQLESTLQDDVNRLKTLRINLVNGKVVLSECQRLQKLVLATVDDNIQVLNLWQGNEDISVQSDRALKTLSRATDEINVIQQLYSCR